MEHIVLSTHDYKEVQELQHNKEEVAYNLKHQHKDKLITFLIKIELIKKGLYVHASVVQLFSFPDYTR